MPEGNALYEQPARKVDNEPEAIEKTEPLDQSTTTEDPDPEVSIAPVESAAAIDFPTVYFAFNSATISSEEEVKMQQTLRLLQENPKLNIIIIGWCDTVGNAAVNLRMSQKRAEALKTWLTSRGISAARIKAVGRGRDFNEKEAAKARRSETAKED